MENMKEYGLRLKDYFSAVARIALIGLAGCASQGQIEKSTQEPAKSDLEIVAEEGKRMTDEEMDQIRGSPLQGYERNSGINQAVRRALDTRQKMPNIKLPRK